MFTQTGVTRLQAALPIRRSFDFSSVLKSPLLHPLNDASAWDRMLSAVNPMWSTRAIPARVVAVIDETADTKTFVLQPARKWPGHRAGQHVVVEVEIDGRRLHRSFSLSSNPTGDGRVHITVKRQSGARVSGWMHEHLEPKQVVQLSAPSGEFVAPESGAEPLLLLSAGSGITPAMAILRDLRARQHAGPIVFLHSCRTEQDLIFAQELRKLAASWPGLDLRIHLSAVSGRLDAAVIESLLPDYARYLAMVCGPAGLTEAVTALYHAAGIPERVRSESYSGRVLPRGGASDAIHAVHCKVTERAFTARADRGLLGEAELAGLAPKHGCRIGLCKTCQCLKKSGSVENLRTGLTSSEPDELIQLCVSVARSPLELAL
jgi:ferredoxin-NADP reductase